MKILVAEDDAVARKILAATRGAVETPRASGIVRSIDEGALKPGVP